MYNLIFYIFFMETGYNKEELNVILLYVYILIHFSLIVMGSEILLIKAYFYIYRERQLLQGDPKNYFALCPL